jgi:hypothetical protein
MAQKLSKRGIFTLTKSNYKKNYFVSWPERAFSTDDDKMERDRFEFTLHDLVPKDTQAVHREKEEYQKGVIY